MLGTTSDEIPAGKVIRPGGADIVTWADIFGTPAGEPERTADFIELEDSDAELESTVEPETMVRPPHFWQRNLSDAAVAPSLSDDISIERRYVLRG